MDPMAILGAVLLMLACAVLVAAHALRPQPVPAPVRDAAAHLRTILTPERVNVLLGPDPMPWSQAVSLALVAVGGPHAQTVEAYIASQPQHALLARVRRVRPFPAQNAGDDVGLVLVALAS